MLYICRENDNALKVMNRKGILILCNNTSLAIVIPCLYDCQKALYPLSKAD